MKKYLQRITEMLCLVSAGIVFVYGLRKWLPPRLAATGTPVPYSEALEVLAQPDVQIVVLKPFVLPWQPWKHLSEPLLGYDHRSYFVIEKTFRNPAQAYLVLNLSRKEAYTLRRKQIAYTGNGTAFFGVFTRYTLLRNPAWAADHWILVWNATD